MLFRSLPSRAIGVMPMFDQGKSDDKIIAVHSADPEYAEYREIGDLPAHRMKEIARFFEDYKKLEKKTVRVKQPKGCSAARRIVKRAFEDYEKLDR